MFIIYVEQGYCGLRPSEGSGKAYVSGSVRGRFVRGGVGWGVALKCPVGSQVSPPGGAAPPRGDCHTGGPLATPV